jgi:predicted RNA-binding protein with PUA-like domain
MGYHIFLVGQANFKTCLRHGVYGGTSHNLERINSEIIAGFESIRPGDFAFFYVKNVGVYGLWRVTSRPFLDTQPIWGDTAQVYPYRVCFEPTVRAFPRPIALSDILDLRDKGKIWTFDLGTLSRKNHNPITADEGKELIRLLLRNNPLFQSVSPIPDPYPQGTDPLPLRLQTDARGRLRFEGYFNAWFMRSFAEGKLKDVVGEYRDFLNFVPTSFNTVMDIFLTHATSIDSIDILHNLTCMELKTGTATEQDLSQVIKYENWLVRKLANGDTEMVQSILVAHAFDNMVLDYARRRKAVEEKRVRLLTYQVSPAGDDIVLHEAQ